MVSDKTIILLLIGLDEAGVGSELGGITRLQKLLFLAEKEGGVRPSNSDFEFTAYKAGPCSTKLYDDIEFLENLGLLEGQVVGEANPFEAAEINKLSFEDLMGEDALSDSSDGGGPNSPDAYQERVFRLTEKGRKKIEDLISDNQYKPIIEGIRKIKSKYGKYSLADLLYYVYTKYPGMTTESEIKDQVLQKRRRI